MFWRRRSEADFSEELKAHLQLEIDRLLAEGRDEDQAYRSARRNLGNLQGANERFYEANRLVWLEQFWNDVRHAIRRLRKAPVFAISTVLTIALGIGATTSIFTLVHAVVFRSLAVRNPNELYRAGKKTHCCEWGGITQSEEFSIFSTDLYRYLRDHTNGFSELAGFQAGEAFLGVKRHDTREPAKSEAGEFVSGNYFAMFGVNAFAGRTLIPGDYKDGASPVAVMSYRTWQVNYGLDPAVIGGIFNINLKPFTIVGITPPSFFGDSLRQVPPDFFIPIADEPLVQGDSSISRRPDAHWLDLIGRLQPGARASEVEAHMRVVLHQWMQSHAGDMSANERAEIPKQMLYLSPGGAGITSMREQYEHWLNILMTVSSFVLLIVCANVANLMLVRGMEQRQQTSLSMALGARSMRLVRQALTECVLLSLLGGLGGVAVAFGGTRLILHYAFNELPGFGSIPISAAPSIPVLLFAFAVSLITGIVFGIAPAWMATRVDPIEALRGANRSTKRAGSLPRKVFVILQAALALVLLSASGLLTATLRKLENQDFGFQVERRMVLSIDPLLAGYRAEQLTGLYRRLRASLGGIPGVSSVALALYSPQSGDNWNEGIRVDGHPAPGPNEDILSTWDRVTPGFFETIGNPILRGRPITEADTATSRRVAVINQAFAKRFFKGEDPIGKHFGRFAFGPREFEVAGIAKDARILPYELEKPIKPFFFAAESQSSVFPKAEDTFSDLRSHFLHNIVVLMKPGAVLTEAAARHAVAAVDPDLPLNLMLSMDEQVAGVFVQQRLIARLTSLFGVLALLLASIGLYGVTSYNAGSRTMEIGVRMALGANRGNVLTLILRGAFALIGIGLLVGLPLAVSAGWVLGNQLYGINPHDPMVIGIAIATLGFSGFVAALVPALRATSVSPIQALRTE
ncbi:MAG TPA: ABC transporter permease [Bryobacteraceae bacterium]|jgi:predicted permease|nr:ABC transporter permease [Bryobacteraceae bacterium]